MADGWEAFLDPGERVLWQGRPDGGLAFGVREMLAIPFGLLFAGFAFFWMSMAFAAGGLFWMFGLLHFAVGLIIAFGPLLWGAWLRRHSVYSLTDRRAFIASDLPLLGRRLRYWTIRPESPVSFDQGHLANVWFATEERRGSKGRRYQVRIGFERIADGQQVHALIRQIQRSAADA